MHADTLNIYTSPVYDVLNAGGSAFLKGILPTLQSHGWYNGTHAWRAPIGQWGPGFVPTDYGVSLATV